MWNARIACAFFTVLGLFLIPSESQAARKLFVFIHGFGGNQIIERLYQETTPERASVGEFNAFYDEILKRAKSSSTEVDIVAFKFDTQQFKDELAGRALNQVLLGDYPVDSRYPLSNVLPERYRNTYPDEVNFITLSNGNLVLREAIAQANVNQDARLLGIFRRSRVFDISPILGGAADARGAFLTERYEELDPFQKDMKGLFSEKEVSLYNASIQDRHYTYLICGDPFTRGIWNFFFETGENPSWNMWNWVSVSIQFKSWINENLFWLFNYERARGKDSRHHIEFAQNFEHAPSYAYQSYVRQLKKFMERPRILKAFDHHSDQKNLMENWNDRKLRERDGFYGKKLSSELNDYAWKHIGEVYSDPLDKTYEKLMSLTERHTLLVFYKPLIQIILDESF